MYGTTTPGDPSSDEIQILHVDDDPQMGGLVATYLERLDEAMVVRAETDPRAGLEHVLTEQVDCVVSDYEMPRINGVELLQLVREEYPNLPFILFTGKGSESVASEAIEAGVTSYLQKNGTEKYELLVNQIRNAVDRQRSRRRARIAQDRLLELYEQTDGFFILDADWTFTYWNDEMAARTGHTAADVLGERFTDAFPDAEGTELHERYQESMRSGEASTFETYYEPHGYWVEVRCYPFDGGLFVHSRDITADRERRQEIEQRNQILESFANTVSHDLRNPLNVAQGRLQLAQETGDFEHLEEVSKAHNRMRNLIDELLRIARGENLERTTVSCREVAERAWDTVTADGMRLVVDDDVSFEAHETELQRVFENLFWNAREHGTASTVRVGTLPDGGFYVEDDGVGIPPEDAEKVFETGFSSVEGNPGYGLSIVKTVADTHDWVVRVTESRDGGARFEFEFRVAADADARGENGSSDSSPHL